MRPRLAQLHDSDAADGDVATYDAGAGLWTPQAPSGGSGIPATLLDAKGDLIVASANDTAGRLPVGSNGQFLTADSTQTLGVKWDTLTALTDPTTTKGDLITRTSSAITRRAVGSNGQVLTADSAETDGVKWATPSGGGSTPVIVCYAPAAQTVYQTSSATMVDVDATNLAITFTAPASGNILVRLGAFTDNNSGTGPESFWGLRESTTNISGSIGRIFRALNDEGYVSYDIYLTGVSAGSHTYKWSYACTGVGPPSARIIIQDGSAVSKWAPALMQVWSL